MLVLLSGLPGVGKSAVADGLARALGATVLSVDPIEAAIWRAGIPPSFETGVAAYEVGAALARHQLALGQTVIADAANSLEVGRRMWRAAAQTTGAPIRVIHVVCRDRALHRARLAARQRDLPGFPEPTWEAVEARAREFEPWNEPVLTLDTSGDREDVLRRALAYVA